MEREFRDSEMEKELNDASRTEDNWRQLVTELRRSDLTVAEFCRGKQIVNHQFNYWKAKIDRIDAKRERAAQKVLVKKRQLERASLKKKTLPKAKFAQVKLTDHALDHLEASGPAQPQRIEIALPNGILVRLNECSANFLSSVITALEKR
jgi:hypothetical protein